MGLKRLKTGFKKTGGALKRTFSEENINKKIDQIEEGRKKGERIKKRFKKATAPSKNDIFKKGSQGLFDGEGFYQGKQVVKKISKKRKKKSKNKFGIEGFDI